MQNIKGLVGNIDFHYREKELNVLSFDEKPLNGRVFAWRGDIAYAKLILKSNSHKFNKIMVEAEDFVSESGNIFPKSQITASFIRSTNAFVGNGMKDNGSRESFPDVLEKAEFSALDENEFLQVWLEFAVPKNTEKGTYNGSILVHGDEETLKFRFELEISSHVLPQPQDFRFDIELWQYPYSVAQYYNWKPFSTEHVEYLKKHLAIYRDYGGHAVTASIVEEPWNGQTYGEYPSMIKWSRGADGKFRFDFTDFDKWIDLCREIGIGDKIICYSLIPWKFKITYLNERNGKIKATSPRPGTRKYNKIWGQFLDALITHCEEKGFIDSIYIGIDERPKKLMEKAFDLIERHPRSDGKKLKIAAAMDHFGEKFLPLIDRIDAVSVGSVSVKPHMETYQKLAERRRTMQKKTAVYTCVGHYPNSFVYSQPCESYWTPLFALSNGANGYLRWAYDAWVKDPLRDTTHEKFESGDCFLVYPDERDKNSPEPRSSVRFEMLTSGIRDVNKLILLREMSEEAKNAVDELLTKVKPEYDHLKDGVPTEKGTAEIAVDMENIRNEIEKISSICDK